mmetsp:Transcript_1712/g.2557  ORF Transcript_1712/g.2557 Transcript_1712/m.2557 type:complete len:101 (-) Transcript_1712:85-387(-)
MDYRSTCGEQKSLAQGENPFDAESALSGSVNQRESSTCVTKSPQMNCLDKAKKNSTENIGVKRTSSAKRTNLFSFVGAALVLVEFIMSFRFRPSFLILFV